MITSVRGYYATNVVGRVLANPGSTQVVHNYELIPGAIPIPATLSLELGKVIGATGKYQLPLRLGLSLQELYAASTGRI